MVQIMGEIASSPPYRRPGCLLQCPFLRRKRPWLRRSLGRSPLTIVPDKFGAPAPPNRVLRILNHLHEGSTTYEDLHRQQCTVVAIHSHCVTLTCPERSRGACPPQQTLPSFARLDRRGRLFPHKH